MPVRKTLTILALSLFLSCSSEPEIEPDNQSDQVVFVTKTGEKYHREDCPHLSKSKYELTLDEAIAKGYQACKTCAP